MQPVVAVRPGPRAHATRRARETFGAFWSQLLDASGVTKASAQTEVVVGAVVHWDPCAETPDDPNCQLDGF